MIRLTTQAHDFIAEVTRNCNGEVGGMGYCHVVGRQVVVTDAFLLPQEVTSGSVDFDHDAIAIACERAAIAGKSEELRFSWHSHGKMSNFWSDIDDTAITAYLACGTPWLASLVVNRKGDMLGRVDVANVEIVGVAQFHDVKVDVDHIDRTDGRAKAEIAEHVRQGRWFAPKGKKVQSRLAPSRLHEPSDTDWARRYSLDDDDDDAFLGDSDRVFTG